MVLASHTVQVTIEAKARPINTAFTIGSALRYMPHGLRSRGSVAVATTLSCASAGKGTISNAIMAARAATQGQQMPDDFPSDQGKCYDSPGRRRTATRISSAAFFWLARVAYAHADDLMRSSLFE